MELFHTGMNNVHWYYIYIFYWIVIYIKQILCEQWKKNIVFVIIIIFVIIMEIRNYFVIKVYNTKIKIVLVYIFSEKKKHNNSGQMVWNYIVCWIEYIWRWVEFKVVINHLFQ